jgi:Tfp pilus assembly protein PilW
MRNQKGFTVVEVLVVALFLVIIGGGFLTSYLTGQSSYLSADASIQVQQEARRAFDNMVKELREAKLLSDPAGGGQLDFQIALGYNTPVACGGICWGAKDQNGVSQTGWAICYKVVASGTTNQLQRQILNGVNGAVQGTPRVLANYVNSDTTSFSASSGVVTINFESRYAKSTLPGGFQSTGVLTSQVKLRNP